MKYITQDEAYGVWQYNCQRLNKTPRNIKETKKEPDFPVYIRMLPNDIWGNSVSYVYRDGRLIKIWRFEAYEVR